MKKPLNKKTIIFIVLGIVVLLLAGGAIYYFKYYQKSEAVATCPTCCAPDQGFRIYSTQQLGTAYNNLNPNTISLDVNTLNSAWDTSLTNFNSKIAGGNLSVTNDLIMFDTLNQTQRNQVAEKLVKNDLIPAVSDPFAKYLQNKITGKSKPFKLKLDGFTYNELQRYQGVWPYSGGYEGVARQLANKSGGFSQDLGTTGITLKYSTNVTTNALFKATANYKWCDSISSLVGGAWDDSWTVKMSITVIKNTSAGGSASITYNADREWRVGFDYTTRSF